MTDEGYIKFSTDWQKAPAFPDAEIAELNRYRQELYRMGLIGAYGNGIGFGNISCRAQGNGLFYISGSKTGNLAQLNTNHYALVTEVSAAENHLCCIGPVIASSESMSHAAIYEECPQVHGAIHVHSLALWQQLLHEVPTTSASAPYGSPEMVDSIRYLLDKTDLKQKRIFVMEGHEEGVFTFGENLAAALSVLKGYL